MWLIDGNVGPGDLVQFPHMIGHNFRSSFAVPEGFVSRHADMPSLHIEPSGPLEHEVLVEDDVDVDVVVDVAVVVDVDVEVVVASVSTFEFVAGADVGDRVCDTGSTIVLFRN